jgi:hypothetical protein
MTDITAKTFTVTGAAGVEGTRTRIRALRIVCGASTGSVVIREGGASGPIELDLATPAGVTIISDVTIPGDGILFREDPHLTLTNVTSVTIFYG